MKAKLVGEGRTAEIWEHGDEKILKLYREDVSEHNISRQKDTLRYNIAGAPLLSDEEKSLILNYLETLPEGTHLCHGDFHPGNVLMDEQLWVIDWMTGVS